MPTIKAGGPSDPVDKNILAFLGRMHEVHGLQVELVRIAIARLRCSLDQTNVQHGTVSTESQLKFYAKLLILCSNGKNCAVLF